MKTGFLFLFFLIIHSTMGLAQCGQKTTLTGLKTTYLDGQDRIQRTVDEKSVIHMNPTSAVLVVNGVRKMNFKVTGITCHWNIPFKEGLTHLSAVTSMDEGEESVTMDIAGKKGKITLLFRVADHPDQVVQVEAQTFTEDQ